jgi:preprotein translocase subunit SecE
LARNRQRAKERQARRKAQRQADGAAAEPQQQPEPTPEPEAPPAPEPEPDHEPHELSASEQLRSGAPPTDLGTSESVLEFEQALDEQEGLAHYDPEQDHPEEDEVAAGPRGVRGGDEAEHKERSRLVQFLYAVVAELRRVQWPDRQTLTTLTGVVLGFVVLAGGYLGLLDAIFSRVIQAIL